VVDDGKPALSANIGFSVVVNDVNSRPVFVGLEDQTIDENSPFEYLILAQDEDSPANSLIFSLDDQAPKGMQIGITTGMLEWTPNEEKGGEKFLVTVTVTDDGAGRLSSQGNFTVTVTETSSAPTMVSQSFTIDELTGLRFDVQASDSDIPPQELSYSLDKPFLLAGAHTFYIGPHFTHTCPHCIPTRLCVCIFVSSLVALLYVRVALCPCVSALFVCPLQV
jgi:hypothetical protein